MTASLVFWFLVVKLVVAVVFLGVASFWDVRQRLVSNWVWVGFAPLAVVLCVVECLMVGGSLGLLFVSFGLTSFVSLGVFYFGGFGGADCKCVICLGLLFPFFPFTQVVGFVFLVVGVASLVGGVWFCMVNLGRNFIWVYNGKVLFGHPFCFEPWYLKVGACLFGHRVMLSRVDGLFYFPMQNQSCFTFFPKGDDGSQMMGLEQCYSGSYEVFVWASPGVPLIPFITGGLVFSVLCWLLLIV